jgi:hypothetical protein
MWVDGNRRGDYTALLLCGIVLLAISQGLESMEGATTAFFRGLMIGLSIVCSAIGLWLYARQRG